MINRDDVWKAFGVLAAISTALTAHVLKLPPAWEAAMPYVEFCSGIVAIVFAYFMNQTKRG